VQHGFTLIELSIVLVIIGLIVGGVVTGSELIEQSKLRSQITQIERYQTAVNAFTLKYNALPGDVRGAQADAFGMITRSGLAGHGDGNGILEACAAHTVLIMSQVRISTYYYGCEVALFWTDLSMAELIPERFDTATDAYINIGTDASAYLPRTKLGGGYVYPSSLSAYGGISADIMWGNQHCVSPICYTLGGFSATTTVVSNNAFLRPQQAYWIDSKLDDGKPDIGSVVGWNQTGAVSASHITPGNNLTDNPCFDGTTREYKLSGAAADELSCVLAIGR